MSDRRHTPGPWRISPDKGNAYNRRITSDHSPHIAKVYGWGNGDTTNSYLIAAAPEMLGALIQVRARFADRNLGPDERDTLRRVNEAIAKAKGDAT